MANSNLSVTEHFPYKEITRIQGPPTYSSIKNINQILSPIASSIHLNLENGQQGLLALTLPEVIYNNISAMPFVYPVNPGPLPAIVPYMTGH